MERLLAIFSLLLLLVGVLSGPAMGGAYSGGMRSDPFVVAWFEGGCVDHRSAGMSVKTPAP